MDLSRFFVSEPWRVFYYGTLAHLLRYVLIAGAAYLVFYIIGPRWQIGRKIQKAFPGWSQMRREVLYSLCSFAIFGATGLLTLALHRAGWAQLYLNVGARGWPYLWLSVVALTCIHDTWFYWTHRLMHWKRLFPVMHRVHHLSHNPSPWASFSFHPLEAVVQAIVLPLTILILPLHPFAVVMWLIYMTVMNVLGHLGFEILPRGFASHGLFRWHNTSTHHDMHHRHVNCNYGLYFNFWDHVMNTNHARYEAEYARITGARCAVSQCVTSSGEGSGSGASIASRSLVDRGLPNPRITT